MTDARPSETIGRASLAASADGSVVEPATLLRLIEDSGYSFPVIEEAVRLLRRGLARVDLADRALAEILRQHLLAVGSPTDVSKYFSLEVLQRANEPLALETMSDVAELLARSPLVPERPYHVERTMLRVLGQFRVARALPALALLAGRGSLPICRTAAKAVVAIVGTDEREAIAARLSAADLPEASRPKELASCVARALGGAVRRSSTGSDRDKKRTSRPAAAAPPEGSDQFLRPEPKKVRQARLRAVLRAAGRDPARCGNCDLALKCTIVHVVPLARGGTDRPGNLVPLCPTCKARLPRRARIENDTAPPPASDVPQLPLFS